MNRSRKEVTMIVAMVALLLFAAFNFLVKPQRSELSNARNDRLSVEEDVSAAELLLRAPVATTPTADAGAAAPAEIPADPAVAQLLRQLQAAADDTGVTLAAVTPSQLSENPSGPGGSMQIAIAASGSHVAVQAYVQGLRDLERLLVIEQVAINTPVAALGQPQQPDQVQLSVRVFTLQPPPSAAVPTPTSAP